MPDAEKNVSRVEVAHFFAKIASHLACQPWKHPKEAALGPDFANIRPDQMRGNAHGC
jgi:hypothetical protein